MISPLLLAMRKKPASLVPYRSRGPRAVRPPLERRLRRITGDWGLGTGDWGQYPLDKRLFSTVE
jgi:hypothetical protein